LLVCIPLGWACAHTECPAATATAGGLVGSVYAWLVLIVGAIHAKEWLAG